MFSDLLVKKIGEFMKKMTLSNESGQIERILICKMLRQHLEELFNKNKH